MLSQRFDQALFSEFFPCGIARFCNAVGIEWSTIGAKAGCRVVTGSRLFVKRQRLRLASLAGLNRRSKLLRDFQQYDAMLGHGRRV